MFGQVFEQLLWALPRVREEEAELALQCLQEFLAHNAAHAWRSPALLAPLVSFCSHRGDPESALYKRAVWIVRRVCGGERVQLWDAGKEELPLLLAVACVQKVPHQDRGRILALAGCVGGVTLLHTAHSLFNTTDVAVILQSLKSHETAESLGEWALLLFPPSILSQVRFFSRVPPFPTLESPFSCSSSRPSPPRCTT